MKPFQITDSFSDQVLCTHFICVSISAYFDNGTTKVPISSEIGVRVHRPTSKICNYPIEKIGIVGGGEVAISNTMLPVRLLFMKNTLRGYINTLF